MIQRCSNPNHPDYRHYGGRGIRVCERWLQAETFLADMGERPSAQHTLERKDNNGPYSPDNCRWATQIEQCQNLRKSRLLEYQGETLTIAEWARRAGLSPGALWGRLDRGWSVERALTTPARQAAPRPEKRGSANSRKTHCPQGHPYDEANTFYVRNQRQCKACRRAYGAAHYQARREEICRKARERYHSAKEQTAR